MLMVAPGYRCGPAADRAVRLLSARGIADGVRRV